jgi:hypothetical protein
MRTLKNRSRSIAGLFKNLHCPETAHGRSRYGLISVKTKNHNCNILEGWSVANRESSQEAYMARYRFLRVNISGLFRFQQPFICALIHVNII